jgi:hypothetical protein
MIRTRTHTHTYTYITFLFFFFSLCVCHVISFVSVCLYVCVCVCVCFCLARTISSCYSSLIVILREKVSIQEKEKTINYHAGCCSFTMDHRQCRSRSIEHSKYSVACSTHALDCIYGELVAAIEHHS